MTSRWAATAMLAVFAAAPLCAQPADSAAIVGQNKVALQQTLTSPTSTPAQRDEAARLMLERRMPGAGDVFLEIVRQTPGNRDAKSAVAKAVAARPDPDPRLIPALAAMLGADRIANDPAAAALANYKANPEARRALLDFVRDVRQTPASRAAAVKVLGNVVHPAVVSALIDLLADVNQPELVHSAAQGALKDMTGLQQYGRDVVEWRAWQAANPRDDAAWIAKVQAMHADWEERQLADSQTTIAKMSELVAAAYQSAPDAQKDRMMAVYLDSPDPQIRVLGIKYYSDAFSERQHQPQIGKDRIPAMLGDSDMKVRLAAARAVRLQNLVSTPGPIVTQLALEPEPDVRAELVNVLGSMQAANVTSTLLGLLHDPSLKVAMTAAQALHDIGSQLAQKDPVAAIRLAAEMTDATKRTTGPRAVEFRAAIIGKQGFLRDPTPLRQLANDQKEPTLIRISALAALSERKDPNLAQQLEREVPGEQNIDVKIAYLEAIAKIGTFENDVQGIFPFTQDTNERSAIVRAAAQRQFEVLVQTATDRPSLKAWSSQLKNNPEMQLAVQRTLVQRLAEAESSETNPDVKANIANDLAGEQQNLGAMYLVAKDYKDAVEPLRAAMNFWNKKFQGLNVNAADVVNQLMTALLEDGQYKEACDFAREQIRPGNPQAGNVQVAIKEFVDKLKTDGEGTKDIQKLNNAIKLTNLALELGLDARFRTNLEAMRKDAQSAIDRMPRTAALWVWYA